MDIDEPHLSTALFAGSRDELIALNRRLAERDGPIVSVHVAPYPAEFLFDEVSLSVNTAAAGGNASLMTIG
jgi:RHH-type proline utilization regulon transcriptional repressor/proline dehydrogenase/delta 1-pyrroline-5-carboxylate dehydrogenase